MGYITKSLQLLSGVPSFITTASDRILYPIKLFRPMRHLVDMALCSTGLGYTVGYGGMPQSSGAMDIGVCITHRARMNKGLSAQ